MKHIIILSSLPKTKILVFWKMRQRYWRKNVSEAFLILAVITLYARSHKNDYLNFMVHTKTEAFFETLIAILNQQCNQNQCTVWIIKGISLKNYFFCPYNYFGDFNIPLSLYNRPLCPPIILILGWWSSDPGA